MLPFGHYCPSALVIPRTGPRSVFSAQEELEQWSAAAAQKEADALVLERYRRADEARVKELGMALERASRAAAAARRDMDEEVAATAGVQGELAKAADDFRGLHAQRTELLGQWQDVLAAVERRDGEVRATGEALAERRAALARLHGELAAAAAALEAEAAVGRGLGKRIAARERGIKRSYDALASAQTTAAEAEDGLDLLTNSAAGAADEAARATAANGHLRAEVARRAVGLEEAQQALGAARARLEAGVAGLGGAQERLAALEAVRAAEAARAAELDRTLAAAAKAQFRAAQDLAAAREECARLEGEGRGARGQGRNLGAALARLEGHAARQQEVLYNVEFQLVQV